MTGTDMAYVSISKVRKTYASPRGPVPALRDIDLGIEDGAFVSILGPSGCGKSTLLKCIAGLEPVSGGSISVGGRALKGPPEDMGIVFQRDVLLDWRTILDNVLITGEFIGRKGPQMRERASALLSRFGLDGFENRHPWELSGGMRQRVAICRALLCDPKLLLMDEPFGALDAMTRDDLNLELARIWQETKKTVVFVTHGIQEAVFLSDRVVVMSARPGRIARIVDVPFERPRHPRLMGTAAFAEIAAEIRAIFDDAHHDDAAREAAE